MAYKPTYEELEQRIKDLKKEAVVLHQYKHIVDNSADMLALLDKRFTYIASNKAYLEAFKLTPDELIGQTVAAVFGEEFFDNVIKPHADRCLEGEEVNYQDWFEFPAYERRYMDIAYSPYYSSDNNIAGFVVRGRNITDRKLAKEALQQQTSDLGERVKELNCLYGFSNLMGMPEITLAEIFQGVVDIIPPSWQYPEITCSRILMGEKEYKTKNFKETNWKQTSDIFVQGEVMGTLDVCYLNEKPEKYAGPFLKEEIDLINAIAEGLGHIIERKQTEKTLQDAQEEILRKDKLVLIGRLAGSIAHEIRNPLAVIDSSSYYLKKKLKEADAKTHEHLNRIKSQVDTAVTIIDNLHNLTRTEYPKLERLDLIAFTSKFIDTAKVPKTIDVIKSFSEEVVFINADQVQLSMVYNNILRNAVDAMDGEGTLTVTICKTCDDRVELSFSDTGYGIESENLDRVLQPLFSTKTKGMGFGLSIANLVIEKHGGTFEVKSQLEKGTTITAYLPLHDTTSKEE